MIHNKLVIVLTTSLEKAHRHLISDAHEWMSGIPTIPVYYLAKSQPRERAWDKFRRSPC